MTKKARRRKDLRSQKIKMLPSIGTPSAAILLPFLLEAARKEAKR